MCDLMLAVWIFLLNIILLGMPGAGKSTQGKLLSESLNIPWISIGHLLRDEFRKGTPDGIEANQYSSKGLNCPIEIKIRILEKILIEVDKSKNGFVLDNYPRTKDDLKHLQSFTKKIGIKIDKVILLKTSEEEAIERLLEKGQVDVGGKRRDDNSLENIKVRIQKGFKEDAEGILDYFRSLGVLVEINGERSVEEVHGAIMGELN